MSEDLGRALSWDDEIEKESEFTPILPGEYKFTVVDLKRGQFNGSEKMSPCPTVILTLRLVVDGSNRDIQDTLYLNSKAEWKLSQFFLSVGLKKKGEKLKMDWNGSMGRSGMLKTKIDTYNGREYVKVDSYLEASTVPAGFAPPSFR